MEFADVVVVGAGTAANEAAAASRQNGAERIVMLEKAPVSGIGGNGRYSETGFRFVHSGAEEMREFLHDVPNEDYQRMVIPPYTKEEFTADLFRVTQGKINPVLADVLVEDSNEAVHWIHDTGIRFQPSWSKRVINDITYFEPGCTIHVGPGQNIKGGQLEQWFPINQKLGIDLRCDSRVVALHGTSRRVDGVRVSGPNGDYDIETKSVILCSGGFQADPEKRARYLGPNADMMKVRGSRYCTGEVTMMALDLGAKAAGHWQGAHASPIDADAPDVEAPENNIRYSYPFGITVNALGERFFDEGEAESVYTYAKTGRRLVDQPGAIAYQLFDQQTAYLMRLQYQGKPHYEAQTIGELATKIGIRPELLELTVKLYNDACRDDIPFAPSTRDGKCTTGLNPPKSNWATKIDHPPYIAYAATGGITFTYGGLAVNENAQVLNSNDEPMVGLYASGDNLGLFYYNYPSFSGQTRNAVFSRRAAKHCTSQ